MIFKKTVKDESYSLSKIQSIHLQANIADINLSLTAEDKLKIVQYAQKKVDVSFQYDTVVDEEVFTVIDKSKQVSYFRYKHRAWRYSYYAFAQCKLPRKCRYQHRQYCC